MLYVVGLPALMMGARLGFAAVWTLGPQADSCHANPRRPLRLRVLIMMRMVVVSFKAL